MNCPVCAKALGRRTSQGLEAFVCQAHGVWQNWDSVNELIRRSRAEEESSHETALLEGFLWGRLL